MDQAKFFLSSFGGKADPSDPGDPIGQSLRFRNDNSGFHLLAPRDNFVDHTAEDSTLSLWFKVAGQERANKTFFSVQNVNETTAGSTLSIGSYDAYDGGSSNALRIYNKPYAHSGSTQLFRDNSAWYHFVASVDVSANTTTYYMNGVQFHQAEKLTLVNDGATRRVIGARGFDLSYGFNGYMAAVYFVDGQSLDPTTFGRLNSNGVWVPVDPKKDGDTAWYGANGFHLTFADPADVGKDYSGNGNHFTATGFDTTTGDATYDLMQDSPTNNFATLNPLIANTTGTDVIGDANLSSNDFNGSYPNVAGSGIVLEGRKYWECTVGNGSNSYPYFGITPINNIVNGGAWYTTDTFHYIGAASGNNVLNFGTYESSNLTGLAAGDVFSFAYDADTRECTIRRNNAEDSTFTLNTTNDTLLTPMVLTAISNKGYINYGQQPFQYAPPAGFEPLSTGNMPTPTIDDGREHFRAITGPGTGTFTSEIINANNTFGTDYLAGASYSNTNATNAARVLDGSTATLMYPSGYVTLATVTLGTPIPVTGTLRIYYQGNPGGSNNTSPMRAYINGVAYGTGYNNQWVTITGVSQINSFGVQGSGQSGSNWAAAGLYAIEIDGKLVVNAAPGADLTFQDSTNFGEFAVGDRTFSINPIGASGTIDSIDAGTSTMTLSSTSGTWVNGQRLYSTASGPGILGLGLEAFPSGLWWIKDRANANQHQLVDSIRGIATARCSPAGEIRNYSAPSGDSVAWCWSAPDEFNDTASDIDSTGRRNVDAGFSIRKYTGNATTQQGIAHGLSTTPEFIIVCREETGAAANTSVWHKDLTANVDSRLVLETNAAVATNAGVWSQSPDVTNIYVGNNNLTNKSATDYTAYVWTAIPGHSVFGSYTGNNNADGPFVYLGFRPALVIIKKSNASGTWLMYDSTRDVSNPVTTTLRSDLTNAEVTNQGELDFLSNGFKVRSTAAQMNANSTFVYAAFAENPFQTPVTAR